MKPVGGLILLVSALAQANKGINLTVLLRLGFAMKLLVRRLSLMRSTDRGDSQVESLVQAVEGLLNAVGWQWAREHPEGVEHVFRIIPPPGDNSQLLHFIWVDEAKRRLSFRSVSGRDLSDERYWDSMDFANAANFVTTLTKVCVFPAGEGPARLRMSHVLDSLPLSVTLRDLAQVHRLYVAECIAVHIEFDTLQDQGGDGVEAAGRIPARIGHVLGDCA